jgi:RNA polymerase sigma-70 factor (ECF subfamily)
VSADYLELEDRELIHRIALREKAALEALYDKYATAVYSLVMFMLRQEAVAEEVTQDIFLNVWLKASTYKPELGEARTWVMSITHHKAIDAIRSRQRALAMTEHIDSDTLELIPSRQLSTDEEVERNLDRERVLEALSTLPPAQREVIMLSYFEGYSQSEIAQRLQKPLGTIKTRVRLAMQKLRAMLDHHVIE